MAHNTELKRCWQILDITLEAKMTGLVDELVIEKKTIKVDFKDLRLE